MRVIEKMFTESNYRLIDDFLLLTTSVEYAGLCLLHIHPFSDGGHSFAFCYNNKDPEKTGSADPANVAKGAELPAL